MMDINELCVSPDMIWTSLDLGSSCGNVNEHSLVHFIVPPFGSTTAIGGLLAVVFSWGFLGLI